MPTAPGRSIRSAGVDPALVVVCAGVSAALHVGKLPPAIAVLQQALGMTLVQAAFLLSLVQLAGMTVGIAVGLIADGIGLRRSMASGLLLLAGASALGGASRTVWALLLLRAVEGLGFLLVVLPAPSLVRQLVAPGRMHRVLGLWGAYMPFGAAVALLTGPAVIGAAGWPAWWWTLAAVSLAAAAWLLRAVPSDAARRALSADRPASAPAGSRAAWTSRLRRTLASRGPWLVAASFAVYSGQWLAVIGFLPAIYAQAGLPAAASGALTALAAAVNMVGNVASGRLLHRGVWPPALLRVGYAVMGVSAAAAFAAVAGEGLAPWLRYGAVLAFSAVGGVIPGTLFAMAVRLAPSDDTLSTTVGWMQQWSAAGQFAGPPLVAWVADHAGGWHYTWLVTGACALAGLWLAGRIGALLGR